MSFRVTRSYDHVWKFPTCKACSNSSCLLCNRICIRFFFFFSSKYKNIRKKSKMNAVRIMMINSVLYFSYIGILYMKLFSGSWDLDMFSLFIWGQSKTGRSLWYCRGTLVMVFSPFSICAARLAPSKPCWYGSVKIPPRIPPVIFSPIPSLQTVKNGCAEILENCEIIKSHLGKMKISPFDAL